MQDKIVKLNAGLPWQKQHSKRRLFSPQIIALKFKEDSFKVRLLGYSFAWCWNLDTSESRSEIPEQKIKCCAGEGPKSVGPNM